MKVLLILTLSLSPIQAKVAELSNSQYNLPWSRRVPLQRGKPMEILLALAGITGLALLLAPAGPLPSESDFKKAQDKLKDNPNDPDASTIVGKYYAFVLGDYDSGMKYLAQSSDKTLRTLAEHERAPLYADTPIKQVGMGDEWTTAAKSFPSLFRIFYDRANSWYVKAWADMKNEPLWGDKLREQGRKLAMSRPPGPTRNGLPKGWSGDTLAPGGKMPIWDGTVSHTGSYSIKILPGNEKVKGSQSGVKTDNIPMAGAKTVEMVCYVMSDGTETENDRVGISFFNDANAGILTLAEPIPGDQPFWTRISIKTDVPKNADHMTFGAGIVSKKGAIWIDDASVKINGKEVLKSPSFEQ